MRTGMHIMTSMINFGSTDFLKSTRSKKKKKHSLPNRSDSQQTVYSTSLYEILSRRVSQLCLIRFAMKMHNSMILLLRIVIHTSDSVVLTKNMTQFGHCVVLLCLNQYAPNLMAR